jgi:hypothetical protein
MPPKEAKHAGAAGGGRKKRKPTQDAKGIPLDSVTNPPEIGRSVRLMPEADKYSGYEELKPDWVYPMISQINGNGTVEVLWKTRNGQFHVLDVDLASLCYTIAMPGVDVHGDETLAEIKKRQAEQQQANDAKTKSDQDSERALEKARLDAQKAADKRAAVEVLAMAQTEKMQAAMAKVMLQREDFTGQLKKRDQEIAALKAQLAAKPAQPTLQAATQEDLDKAYATIADLNAQLTAATTGAARNNDEEVDELRRKLREKELELQVHKEVLSSLKKRGFEDPSYAKAKKKLAAGETHTPSRQKRMARELTDDTPDTPPKQFQHTTGLRKKGVRKVATFSDKVSSDSSSDDDKAGPRHTPQSADEGIRYSDAPVRRRGGGIAGRAAGGRAAGERVREREKPYDRPKSAPAGVAQKPPDASDMMEMEEVSDDDTAGAGAPATRQMTKPRAPLTSEEIEEGLLCDWLLKLEREYEADLKRWAELNKSNPEGHQLSGVDFWYPGRIEHKRWKRLTEFLRYVVLNLPLPVYISNNTNNIRKWVFAEDHIDMSHSNFDPKHGTNWRIVVKFQRQKSDGTWENVLLPISSTFIIGFEVKGITVWAHRHPTLEANEKNWCDMWKELLRFQEEKKRRPVSLEEFLSWAYVPASVRTKTRPQLPQPELPQQPQPELHPQAPPPPPVDERPTLAGKRVPVVYNVLVHRQGGMTAQRDGSPEPQVSSSDSSSDSSPEPEQPARPTGALGGAAARKQYPRSSAWQNHEEREKEMATESATWARKLPVEQYNVEEADAHDSVTAPPPVNDGGVDAPPPPNDGGVDAPPPPNDGGVDAPPPPNDGGVDAQPPPNDGGVDAQPPDDGGVDSSSLQFYHDDDETIGEAVHMLVDDPEVRRGFALVAETQSQDEQAETEIPDTYEDEP